MPTAPHADLLPGRFIVLEGIDGSGTTSQTTAVGAALRAKGHRVHETREPTDGTIGRQIRSALAGPEGPSDPRVVALLFAADRLEHVQSEIEPALARGELVLCDRYVISSWVYQSLECDADWVRAINSRARWPDQTVILSLEADVAMSRVRARTPKGEREIYETLEVQRAVAQGYRDVLAARHQGVTHVDGALPIAEVTAAVLDAVLAGLGGGRAS